MVNTDYFRQNKLTKTNQIILVPRVKLYTEDLYIRGVYVQNVSCLFYLLLTRSALILIKVIKPYLKAMAFPISYFNLHYGMRHIVQTTH